MTDIKLTKSIRGFPLQFSNIPIWMAFILRTKIAKNIFYVWPLDFIKYIQDRWLLIGCNISMTIVLFLSSNLLMRLSYKNNIMNYNNNKNININFNKSIRIMKTNTTLAAAATTPAKKSSWSTTGTLTTTTTTTALTAATTVITTN